MAKRYQQLEGLIAEAKPTTIVEVGVHRGLRARQMIESALLCGAGHVRYIGYDVFDTEGEAFHEAAFNTKGIPLEEEALRNIGRWDPRLVQWELIVGDTRKTLHGRHVAADFVFIDGDHRCEVIAKDYSAFRGGVFRVGARMIVLDDYYRPDRKGRIPDLEKVGCNRLVDGLPARSVEILPSEDRVKEGGVVHLAVVRLGRGGRAFFGNFRGSGWLEFG